MGELEYEVLFVQCGVNVVSIAFVGEGEGDDTETVEQIAVRRALDNVNCELGTSLDDDDFEEIIVTHTGTIGG